MYHVHVKAPPENADDHEFQKYRITLEAAALLRELKYAHQIIKNGLNIMNIEQKNKWAKANESSGCGDEEATRAHVRDAIINQATNFIGEINES
jgi:hypothetical protein